MVKKNPNPLSLSHVCCVSRGNINTIRNLKELQQRKPKTTENKHEEIFLVTCKRTEISQGES